MEQAIDVTEDGEFVQIDVIVRSPDGKVVGYEFHKARNVKARPVVEEGHTYDLYLGTSASPVAIMSSPDVVAAVEFSFESVRDDEGRYMKVVTNKNS